MNTLEIKNLSLIYSNKYQAIKDISLNIKNGMFGLLGPNGAGKTSLMKTIVGLQKPTSGSIIFNDVDIVNNPDYVKKNLGFLPQGFGVYPKVSALDLLNHIAILKGVDQKSERTAQIESLLDKVNLWDYRNKEVYTFSGGMRQRFGVAQALIGKPAIIIVDEPTAGLDPEERNRFNAFLNEISTEVIVVLSTHLVEDVRNLCSEMTIMNSGRILLTGKPNDLITDLKNKIWSKEIDKKDLAYYQSNYCVVSQQLIERALQITVFSINQPSGFDETEPLLEHVYFNALTQNN